MFYPSRHSGLSLIYMNLGLKSYITSSFFAHRYLQCGFGLEFLYVRDTLFASPNLLIFSLFCAPGRLIFVAASVGSLALSFYLIPPIGVTVGRWPGGRRERSEPQDHSFPLTKAQFPQDGSLWELLSLYSDHWPSLFFFRIWADHSSMLLLGRMLHCLTCCS